MSGHPRQGLMERMDGGAIVAKNAVVTGEVTVGHRCVLHGVRIGDRCLVGIGAIVLKGAVLETESMVGAGAVVPEGFRVPSRTLALGVPARVVRELTDEEVRAFSRRADAYRQKARLYLAPGETASR